MEDIWTELSRKSEIIYDNLCLDIYLFVKHKSNLAAKEDTKTPLVFCTRYCHGNPISVINSLYLWTTVENREAVIRFLQDNKELSLAQRNYFPGHEMILICYK